MIKKQKIFARNVGSGNQGIKCQLTFLFLLIILTESCRAFFNFVPSSEVQNKTTNGSEDFAPFENENEKAKGNENENENENEKDSQQGIVQEILPTTTTAASQRKSRRTEIGKTICFWFCYCFPVYNYKAHMATKKHFFRTYPL